VLVAPVVPPGVRTCSVYLPGGAGWLDGWTGEALRGGLTVFRPAPCAAPPFFIRQDAPVWVQERPPPLLRRI
jgi:alpha-glucosidase (family GH31 glycosyl hydrolase)